MLGLMNYLMGCEYCDDVFPCKVAFGAQLVVLKHKFKVATD